MSEIFKMKKFIFLIFCMIFLVGNVSAFEFDNVKSYDPQTKEVIIKNAFGLGADIGKAKLNTPLNVKVGAGYQKVAEFDLWAYEDYNNILKQFIFTDLRKGENIIREFDIKFLETKEIEVFEYDMDCSKAEVSEFSYLNYNCIDIIVGSHFENKEVWTELIFTDLKKDNKITIGIFTEVKIGDYIDWIPTIYGVEIPEWASWSQSLNVDLVAYYKLNETTGTNVINNVGVANATASEDTGNLDIPGIISTAFDFDGTNYLSQPDDPTLDLVDDFTINAWLKWDGQTTNFPDIIEHGAHVNGNINFVYGFGSTDGVLRFSSYDSTFRTFEDSSGTTFPDGDWAMGTIVVDTTNNLLRFYKNGVSISNVSYTFTPAPSTESLYIGKPNGGGVGWTGGVDEVGIWNRSLTSSEIFDLYNNGNAITYDDFRLIIKTTLIIPNDNLNTTSVNIEFSVNSTPTDLNLTNTTLYIWNSSNDLYLSNFTSLSGNVSVITNWTILNIPDDIYIWNALTKGTQDKEDWGVNRTFEVDATPPIINLTAPRGTIDYHKIGNNLSLNWTISDPNLQACWFDYNSTNTTLTCGDNNFSFTPILDKNNITLYSNDSLGNLGSNFTSWNYKVLEINQTYNNETIEGSLETFLATIRIGSGYSITETNLIYNSSSEIGQSFTIGQNDILRKSNLLIPNVNADVNISFFWNITLSDSTVINLISQNQTVLNLGIDNCSIFTKEIFNFTIVDEELQTLLPNATLEIALNIYDLTRTISIVNLSETYLKINPVRICLNINLSADTTYVLDTIVRYEDTGRANEYYNIINFTLTNNTALQNIFLYDLNSPDSTEFQLTFTGSDFLPVENALVNLDRQYLSENRFKTVELPKTDYNGQTVLHMVRNDVIYNLRITKDGIILGNFENLIAFCDDFTIGDCNIELNAFDSVESVFNYNSDLGIIFNNPFYDSSTNKVNFVFVTSDGSSKTVLLNITRNDIFGNRSICNATLTSSGGTLTCDVNPNIDSVLNVNVYTDGILTISNRVELDSVKYGPAGYLILFVMALSFILIFSGSKTGVLISIGLTFSGAIGLGLISGNMIGFGAGGLWLLVIVFIGLYKLNEDREP